jgi:hypothetical protein
MGIPIGTAMLAGAGLNFLGGMFGGAQQGALSKAQLQEQQREFNLPFAYQLSRYQMGGPLRDRAAAMLQARLGAAPGAMNLDPHGFSTRGAGLPGQQAGGPQLGMQQQAARGYQPGQGGMLQNPVANQIMGQLGYPQMNPAGASAPQPPGQAPSIFANGFAPGGNGYPMGRFPQGQRLPYYGPQNAGAAAGAPGGGGY